ncbi:MULTISPECIES: hypothetical protein [unclassified Coleofasciculus]|uniref:hypothetical protein n=1 Tax=Cyanophyceae TaxID=3028117 RepID=UPI0016872ECF|nr:MULTISPECIES: hypothetical protein [unclassified Coleofasciculus]MBD1879327.1 hypothetical protein [Coleofasciculus sp. FACHB-T130]MBD1888276.1 hypothetical protein [Coleofasciculus sp. FACHB-SPT9]MBD2088031.1 hypothetical protein [Coleofasciculus sp. FACHB-542]MBD2538136.1 hypothetical protein [Coleofasciculus sp. FACHB-SPT36]
MRDQIIPGVIFVVALAIFLGGIVGVRFPLGSESAGQVVPAGSQTTTPSPSPTPTTTVSPVPTVTPTATTPPVTQQQQQQQQPATRSNPYTPSQVDLPPEEDPVPALW